MKGLIIRYLTKTAAGQETVNLRIFTVSDEDAPDFCQRRGKKFQEALTLIREQATKRGCHLVEDAIVVIE